MAIGINQSIRVRLTLWYSLVLFGGQCLSGVLVWVLLSHGLRTDLDESLRGRTKGLERYLVIEASDDLQRFRQEMEEYSRSMPADYVIYVRDSHGRVLTSSGDTGNSLLAALPPLTAQGNFATTKLKTVPYRMYGEILQEDGRSYSVILAASANFIELTLHRLSLLLLSAIPGVVIAAAAGGFWISKRALAPVDRMTAEANAIGFDNLSARLAVPRTPDEVQRLATTWNAMLQRIENSFVRMNRFTADASHELRTPLSLIQATVDLALRRPRETEHYRHALQVIRLESARMTQLVEDLLFLARTDSDCDPRHRELFDLRVPIQAASLEVLPKATSKNVQLCQHGGDEPVMILGDENAIRRMIFVLLDNAVKYSPPYCSVSIELVVDALSAVLTVHDAGSGIPPAAKAHIFERFYRADPSRHEESSSYGLGLAIADAVAKQHGISISASSEPGSTTFSVKFQISDSQKSAAAFIDRGLVHQTS